MEPDLRTWLERVQALVVALLKAGAREHVMRTAAALAQPRT
ncbi:hypothetical protein [Kineococcus sp. TRM81007]|nr:hypothetical protein [Kineococcus sp. TRM81007]